MGCCCSKDDDDSNNNQSSGGKGETELKQRKGTTNGDNNKDDDHSSVLCFSSNLSSESIRIDTKKSTIITGYGYGLAAVPIEQDSAYWEAHVTILEQSQQQTQQQAMTCSIMCGVATKKARNFLDKIQGSTNDSSDPIDTLFVQNTSIDETIQKEYGIEYMLRFTNLQHKDVIGILIQQNDFPMIQFFINGEKQYDKSINRFRGVVYPSFYLFSTTTTPSNDAKKETNSNNDSSSSSKTTENISIQIVFKEDEFQQPLPPWYKCMPVMVARGLV